MAAITFDHVTVCYRGIAAVQQVSVQFEAGKSWAIVGPNGAGKSTLLKAAMHLVPCQAGAVRWQQLQRQEVAYLAQQDAIDRHLPVLVRDLVVLGLWHELQWWRGVNSAQWARVQDALEQVGLGSMAGQPIGELSAGQFQRALFARMLVQRARFLLLDEPFNAVDAVTTAELMDVLHGCQNQGIGIVAVVHDLMLAREHFDHILVLDKGIVAAGPMATVWPTLLQAGPFAGMRCMTAVDHPTEPE